MMETELLEMCGYTKDEKGLRLVSEVKSSYFDFDEIVTALKALRPFLDHSDYYLSLRNGQHLITIKNDLLDDEACVALDAEILVWANQHGIELQEEPGQICILGRRCED
jgi:hypothetical protein